MYSFIVYSLWLNISPRKTLIILFYLNIFFRGLNWFYYILSKASDLRCQQVIFSKSEVMDSKSKSSPKSMREVASQVTSHKNGDSSRTRVQVTWLESTSLPYNSVHTYSTPFIDHSEKVYFRSQILELPSIGEYWNNSGVPVLPENVIFTFFRTCWWHPEVHNTRTQKWSSIVQYSCTSIWDLKYTFSDHSYWYIHIWKSCQFFDKQHTMSDGNSQISRSRSTFCKMSHCVRQCSILHMHTCTNACTFSSVQVSFPTYMHTVHAIF